MFILFVIALVSILSYLWLRHRYSYWERHLVPGPKPVFLFGNLFKQLTLQEHISKTYEQWYKMHKDVPYIGFYKLLQPAVMIVDPQLQQDVLVKFFSHFHMNDVTITKDDKLLKSVPFFASGEEWRQSRTVFGTLFSSAKLRSVFPAMLQVCSEWQQYIQSLGSNTEINMKEVCTRFTSETMLRCTFGIDGKSFEPQPEFLDLGKLIFNASPLTAIKLIIPFFVPALQKYLQINVVPKKMIQRFTEILREQVKIRDSSAVRYEDMLQFVLNSSVKYDLTETQIIGVIIGFFTEAYESTSNVLSSALHTLAKHPHIQDELARRVQKSIKENNNEITYDLVHKHEYLEKVAFECMRIHPTLFGMQKLCTEPFTMPLIPGQTQPVILPTGMPVILPFSTAQHDPKYFPDPSSFDPERFSPEQKASRPKSCFMPFSDGPRMCMGMTMALFNLKAGLLQIVYNYHVHIHPNNKPFKLNPMSFFNSPQDGFKLTLTPRKTF